MIWQNRTLPYGRMIQEMTGAIDREEALTDPEADLSQEEAQAGTNIETAKEELLKNRQIPRDLEMIRKEDIEIEMGNTETDLKAKVTEDLSAEREDNMETEEAETDTEVIVEVEIDRLNAKARKEEVEKDPRIPKVQGKQERMIRKTPTRST